MRKAIEKAREVLRDHKTSDPEAILERLGIEVLEVPLAGRLREIYFGDHIVIREGLEQVERRELLAHALCHHLMHAGNHWAQQQRVYSFGNYHEKEAQVFAAFLLMPSLDPTYSIPELAELHDVSQELVELRAAFMTRNRSV